MMDDYGSSITIDNKNLLDDLLGLGGAGDIVGANNNGVGGLASTNPLLNANDDDTDEYFFPKRRNSLNQMNSNFGSRFNLNSNAANTAAGAGGASYLQPVQMNRFYLESPTFTKAEDDIYRYVHSRLSNADLATNREHIAGNGGGNGETSSHQNNIANNNHNHNHNHNHNDIDLHDSLSGDTGGGGGGLGIGGGGATTNSSSNTSSNSSSKPISASNLHQHQVPPPPPPIQHRIGSNRLLSDLAVASLPPHANLIKRDPLIYSSNPATTSTNPIRLSKPSLEDQLLFGDASTNPNTQDLLDSLELTAPPPAATNPNNSNNPIGSNTRHYNAPPLLLNQRRVSPHQPSILDNQYNLQQQQQQQQQQQAQQYLPLQTIPTQGGIAFVLPSPTGAATSAQFIPVPVQIAPAAPTPSLIGPQQQQQPPTAMYYHHTGDPTAALHSHQQPPMFYNTAYPINIPYGNQNGYYATAAAPQQQNDFYQQGVYNNQPSNNKQGRVQQQNNNPYEINNNNGHYNANPLQAPIPTPRNNVKQQQQQQGQQNKQQYYDNGNNFDDFDDNDLNNEFNNLTVYDNNRNNNNNNNNNKPSHQNKQQHNDNNNTNNRQNPEDDDDESKGQQVWQKLQKAAATKNNSSGSKKQQRAAGGIGSSNSNHSLNGNNNNRLNNGAISNSNGAISKKPPLPGKPEPNYLEKNIEAIRNKENLTHRYPEKKYEIVHSNKFLKGGTPPNTKKPPHHLQPLENNYDEDGDGFDPYETKKISIPLDTKNLKDKDHINVDINLRLIDFLPQQQQHNRSMDDFSEDPLARYIKNYETNMSRSLPGSSGSFNSVNGGKHRQPLPPLGGQHVGGSGASSNSKFYPNKPYSHEESRRAMLQHEYESEIKSEDGYLAQLQKSHMKRPPIKTYTIKDYRNFKKDAPTTTNSNTGKLGFDYDNEYYKQKMMKAQKQVDYAERVKARNRILLTEQQRQMEENGSVRSQQQSPPSKTQRAKDYVNTTVFRVRSASLQPSPKQQQQAAAKKRSSDSTEPNVVRRRDSLDGGRQTNRQNGQQLDLNPRYQKGGNANTAQAPDNTAMVRIRDPVTSKVRTIYLSDTQIEELAVRHQMEKSKVSTIQINSSSTTTTTTGNHQQQQQQQQHQTTRQEAPQPTIITGNNSTRNMGNMGLLKKGRQPLNLSSSRDLLARDEEFNNTSSPSNNDSSMAAANSHRRATTINEQDGEEEEDNGDDYRRQYISSNTPPQQQHHKENEVDQLIERHLSEKKKVNEFHAAVATYNDSLEPNNNNHSVEVE